MLKRLVTCIGVPDPDLSFAMHHEMKICSMHCSHSVAMQGTYDDSHLIEHRYDLASGER